MSRDKRPVLRVVNGIHVRHQAIVDAIEVRDRQIASLEHELRAQHDKLVDSRRLEQHLEREIAKLGSRLDGLLGARWLQIGLRLGMISRVLVHGVAVPRAKLELDPGAVMRPIEP